MNPGTLSKRQEEVLKLYGDGLCTKQIADKIGIGDKTVEYHRDQIKTKMNLKSFADIIKLAVRLGLTTLCLTIYAGTVHLVWTNPNSAAFSSNGVNIYYTTNLALPINQWPLLTYITNSPPGTNSFTTNLPTANYFFVGEFTNTFWNFALPFSDPAAYTPPLPTNLLTGFTVLNH